MLDGTGPKEQSQSVMNANLSQNKPFLFISWLSMVFVTVMQS
jgi:hypothetical protein